MLRIKGQIGAWPVDLQIELDREDWAQLAEHLPQVLQGRTDDEAPAKTVLSDPFWLQAQQLLEKAGAVEGPQLFAQLAALVGNESGAKRLLVRLRHCPQVRLEKRGETPVYHWRR